VLFDHPKEQRLLSMPTVVRAYFTGNKTMTRRVITRRNSYIDRGPAIKKLWGELQFDKAWIDFGLSPAGNRGSYLRVPRFRRESGGIVDKTVHRIYPKYQVGDTIWHKEAWCHNGDGIAYRADQDLDWDESIWTPSELLPPELARIVAPIISVRPERIQDISEEDAKAEGIKYLARDVPIAPWYCGRHFHNSVRDAFQCLWNSISADQGYTWQENPWVWVISFGSVRNPV
jgi:hypothetical protein